MWYKRFGYKQPPSGGRGIGCFGIIFVSFLSFLPSVFLSAASGSPWFLLLSIPIAAIGFEFLDQRALNEPKRFRAARLKFHLASARRHIATGANHKAINSIRKAKIYGDIPSKLEEFSKENTDKL